MTIATTTDVRQGLAPCRADRAWVRRSGEVHALAGYLYDNLVQRAQWPLPKSEYVRALILEAAKELGWEVKSRKQLTPQQLGKIASIIRAMIEHQGLASPEEARDARARVTSLKSATTSSDFRQIYKLRQRATDEVGWTPEHVENFTRHQLGGRRRRVRTHQDARRVIFGFEGVLRHGKSDGTTDEHR